MRDRRSERNAATRAEILEAAWALVREEGPAGLSLRDLGRRVGMRAQSLYSYFDSKHGALLDEIKTKREISEELRPRLVAALDEFTNTFIAEHADGKAAAS